MLFEKIPNDCLFKNELDKIVSFYNERLVPAHEKVAFVESNKREGFTCRDLFSVIYPLLQKIKICRVTDFLKYIKILLTNITI